MNLFGNILIYAFRILAMALVFILVSVFAFSTTEMVKNDYAVEKNRLAANIQSGDGKYTALPDFSFLSIAQAVEMSPAYLEKIALQEKADAEKKEKELATALKAKKAKAYAKRRTSSKNGYYKITGYQAVAAQTDSTPNIAA